MIVMTKPFRRRVAGWLVERSTKYLLLCTRIGRARGDGAQGGVGARASDGRAWGVIGDFQEVADRATIVRQRPGLTGR